MKTYLRKLPGGILLPDDEQSAEALKMIAIGDVISVKWSKPRNYKRLQAIHCLFRIAYEHFCEYGVGKLEYKGEAVVPTYDRFRRDLVILAGHYVSTVNIRGEVRLEAKSISYAECSQDEFERIFSDVINAAIKYVYKNTTDEKTLREVVDSVMSFAPY